jgi:hypothetical protein
MSDQAGLGRHPYRVDAVANAELSEAAFEMLLDGSRGAPEPAGRGSRGKAFGQQLQRR